SICVSEFEHLRAPLQRFERGQRLVRSLQIFVVRLDLSVDHSERRMSEDPLKVERITAIADVLLTEESAERAKCAFGLLDTAGPKDDQKGPLYVVVPQREPVARTESQRVRVGVQPSVQRLSTFQRDRNNPLFLALAFQRHQKVVEVNSVTGQR